MLRTLALLVLACSLGAACTPPRSYRPTQSSPVAPPPAESAPTPAESAPTPAESAPRENTGMKLVELAVPDFLPAVVALPQADVPLPLVIAAHGAGGSPEWQCEHWARIVAGRAIVLCPRGRRISLRPGEDGRYYYADHLALEREVMAMVAAARLELGARLARGRGIYTGFSQGATMGALMLVDHADEFPFLLLIEGATAEFSAQRARRFAAGGGKRVAFVCGGKHCASGAERMASLLRRAGLEARAEYVPHGGHTDDGLVGERAAAVFETMLAEALAPAD